MCALAVNEFGWDFLFVLGEVGHIGLTASRKLIVEPLRGCFYRRGKWKIEKGTIWRFRTVILAEKENLSRWEAFGAHKKRGSEGAVFVHFQEG
ncbi:hypothetical protein ES702_03253 [subsurface metagenome]